eukprot:COSAG02_NODE_4136_length_5728_cov_5.776692_6_plen_760_part_00
MSDIAPAEELPAAPAPAAAADEGAAGGKGSAGQPQPQPEGEEGGAAGRKGVRLPRWSAEEERRLRLLVTAEGANSWASKAQRLGTGWVRSANAVQQYYMTMVRKDEQEAATGSRIIARGAQGQGTKRRRSSDEADERPRAAPNVAAAPSVPGRATPDDCRAYLAAMGRCTDGSARELVLRTQEVQRWSQAVHRARARARAADSREHRPLVTVTGAGGYLAAHVIEQLLAQNYRVRGTVRSLETLRDDEAARRLKEIRTLFPTVELFPCDLLDGAANFAAAFDGVSYVIHTACPNETRASNPTTELFRPAVEGVKAVIAAARAAGVRRVVMTSSCGAVQSNRVPTPRDHRWSEKDWNDDSSRRIAPYRYAKAYAERTAWKLAEGNTGSAGSDLAPVDMVSICPAMMLGPPIYRARRTQGLSVRYLTAILEGKFRTGVPGGPCFGIVDVRDVAAAHIKAMVGDDARVKEEGRDESRPEAQAAGAAVAEAEAAAEAAPGAAETAGADEPLTATLTAEEGSVESTGDTDSASAGSGRAGGTDRKRYVLSSAEGVTAMEIVDCLSNSENFIEKHSWACGLLPDSSLIETSYRPRYNVITAAAELGATFRPLKETIVEMADAIVELGIVRPPLSARMQNAKSDASQEVWGSPTSSQQRSNAKTVFSAGDMSILKVESADGSAAGSARAAGSGAGRAAASKSGAGAGVGAGAGKAGEGSGGGRVTYFWTQEEMDKLVRIVQDEGLGDWNRKAWLLGTNRSAGSVEQ